MPLSPRHQQKGTPIQWRIGRMGSGVLDIHPGRVNDVAFGFDDQGRQGLVAEVVLQVTARPENGGGTYPKIRNILAKWLEPRPLDVIIPGLDDVAMDDLYEEAANAATTFLMSGQSLTDIAGALEAATTEPTEATADTTADALAL